MIDAGWADRVAAAARAGRGTERGRTRRRPQGAPSEDAGEMQRCELVGLRAEHWRSGGEESLRAAVHVLGAGFFSASFSISVWGGVFSTTGRPGDWCCGLDALQRFSSGRVGDDGRVDGNLPAASVALIGRLGARLRVGDRRRAGASG